MDDIVCVPDKCNFVKLSKKKSYCCFVWESYNNYNNKSNKTNNGFNNNTSYKNRMMQLIRCIKKEQ